MKKVVGLVSQKTMTDMAQLNFTELEYNSLAGRMPDNENPIFIFTLTDKKNLLAILNDELDIKELVKYELKNRGMNENGNFVGFKS